MIGMTIESLPSLHEWWRTAQRVFDLTTQKNIDVVNIMTPEREKMLSSIPMREIRKTTKILDNQ